MRAGQIWRRRGRAWNVDVRPERPWSWVGRVERVSEQFVMGRDKSLQDSVMKSGEAALW